MPLLGVHSALTAFKTVNSFVNELVLTSRHTALDVTTPSEAGSRDLSVKVGSVETQTSSRK